MATRYGSTSGRLRSFLGSLLLAFVPLAAVFGGLVAFRAGAPAALTLESTPAALGPKTRVVATVEVGGRGLFRQRLELAQGATVRVLAEKTHSPRAAWAFWGPRATKETFDLALGREGLSGLRDGEATLRLVAERIPAALRAPGPVVKELTLPLRLRPPSLEVLSTQHFVTQGGSGVVVYRVGASSARDGVAAGGRWFPGHPLPGGAAGDRFAFFGIPFDLADGNAVRLLAEDDVGNRTTRPFLDQFSPRLFPSETIAIRDDFLAKVTPEILSHSPEVRGTAEPVATFLAINRDLRRANSEALEKLAGGSKEKFLWSRPFQALPRAKVMSAFADRRTYTYDGREVDRQTHLGFDLAATRNTPVPAGNDGVVVLARYFGIYGNAVVLDHGYGLMSLYAHLSALDVAEGQSVGRGDVLGRTGATGLAGGDHLHFTMLVGGMPVNPNEWWDGHWIRDRVARPLGPALPFSEIEEPPKSSTRTR
jgi:hypothetical protein